MIHTIKRVLNSDDLLLSKEFINNYHSYIKYAQRPSRKLYYNLYEDNRMVGVFALGSAFSSPISVKNYMKKYDLQFNNIANNIVFCLYGHKDKNAGTKFLKILRNDSINWWYERYGDELLAFQTFILPPRTGAVYKADNWELIGITRGISRNSITISENEAFDDQGNRKKRVRIKRFKDGTIRYIKQEDEKTDSKLIFMKYNNKVKNKNKYNIYKSR